MLVVADTSALLAVAACQALPLLDFSTASM